MVCFVNIHSVDRIIFAIFNQFNQQWQNRTLKVFTQAAWHDPVSMGQIDFSWCLCKHRVSWFWSYVRSSEQFELCWSRRIKSSMNLQKEYVHYLSRRIVEELIKRDMIEVKGTSLLQERVVAVMEIELSVEERINEEVRSILKDYTEEMRRTGVSYQEMFKIVKNKLVKDKKVIL